MLYPGLLGGAFPHLLLPQVDVARANSAAVEYT